MAGSWECSGKLATWPISPSLALRTRILEANVMGNMFLGALSDVNARQAASNDHVRGLRPQNRFSTSTNLMVKSFWWCQPQARQRLLPSPSWKRSSHRLSPKSSWSLPRGIISPTCRTRNSSLNTSRVSEVLHDWLLHHGVQQIYISGHVMVSTLLMNFMFILT